MKKPTKLKILAIANIKEFFVHRYCWSHMKTRQMTRRMCKDGELILVSQTPDGFYYRSPK